MKTYFNSKFIWFTKKRRNSYWKNGENQEMPESIIIKESEKGENIGW